MKGIKYRDIAFVLQSYNPKVLNDEQTKNAIIEKISAAYERSRNLIGMPDKLIAIFKETSDYEPDKKTAKKIVYDISCQAYLSQFIDELSDCDVIKDKLHFDRENSSIILKVHENFIVRTDLSAQKTFINDKYYYDIEDQELLESYCGFVTDECIYVMYKKKRLPSYVGLCLPYFKFLSNKNKIDKLKGNGNVDMIFTNNELLYKAE